MNGFKPAGAGSLGFAQVERDQAERVNGPAQPEAIIQLAVQRHRLFQDGTSLRVLLPKEQRVANPP